MASTRLASPFLCTIVLAVVSLVACAPSAPPSPTAPPPKPAATTPPPTAAPAKPAPTTAPAATAPAAAAAKPTPSSEQVVADFYQGKTIRIIVGFGPGGTFDTYSRLIARHAPRYLPGNPNIIVENRPGAGSLVAAKAVYNTEPKDGTVILSASEYGVLLQALGAEGADFDARKFSWLGASVRTAYVCAGRTDSDVSSIQETINGKQLIVGTTGPGTSTHDPAAVLNGALGTNLKLVPGYADFNKIKLAIESKEVDGICGGWDGFALVLPDLVQGDKPVVKVLVSLGALTPDALAFPYLKDVPVAESLAKTEEAKQLIRAVNVPAQISKPFAVAPGVPAERVAALRKAVAQAYADPQFLAEAKQANLFVGFSGGEEVQRVVQELLNTPAATLGKLKDILR